MALLYCTTGTENQVGDRSVWSEWIYSFSSYKYTFGDHGSLGIVSLNVCVLDVYFPKRVKQFGASLFDRQASWPLVTGMLVHTQTNSAC